MTIQQQKPPVTVAEEKKEKIPSITETESSAPADRREEEPGNAPYYVPLTNEQLTEAS
jgi:hypothetical protein